MPLLILSFIIQLVLVIHIMKTKRSTTWIWIVIAVPVVGSLAYLVVEILPGFLRSHKGQQAQKNFEKFVNPEKDFNKALNNYNISDNVKNTSTLAEEFMNKEQYDEAKQLFQQALEGQYKHDPSLLFGLAKADFALENYEEVKASLNLMMDKNRDYVNMDAHLLFARTLEALEETESALEVYDALESYSPSPEATFRHASLHQKVGNEEKAQELYHKIIRAAQISGAHHNKLFKEWINAAKREAK